MTSEVGTLLPKGGEGVPRRNPVSATNAGSSGNPSVSLVIPVYGPPTAIEACFESVLAQTLPFDEVIVVDDASPDVDTRAILASWAARTGWRVIRLLQNVGIVSASNIGLRSAGSSFVAFLDCDDLLTENANQDMLSAVSQAEVTPKAVFSQYATFDGAEPVDLVHPGLFELRDYYANDQHLVLEHLFTSHFKMFDVEWLREIGGFPAASDGVQDWFVGVQAVLDTRFIAVPKVLYHHRVHDGQTTNSARARFLRSVNIERRRLLRCRGNDAIAESGRHVLNAARGLGDAPLHLLPAMLMVSTNGHLSVQAATLDRLDTLVKQPDTDWIMILGNAWFHLGASHAFAPVALRPRIGIAVRSDCTQAVHMCRWYSGYLDFIVSADAAVDILIDGYVPDDIARYRLNVS